MIVQHFGNASGDGPQRNLSDSNRFLELVGNAPVIEGVQVQIAWVEEGMSLPNVELEQP